MSPKSKTITILSVLLVMFFSLGCITVTRAFEEYTAFDFEENPPNNSTSQSDEDCYDCDYWDEFEYDANERPILSGSELI
ncbi:MAG: hypothetical protein HN413_01810, partial [Chloroflexi bacterium]|nr:hypothetical protein [Chloroflexota bacterium]